MVGLIQKDLQHFAHFSIPHYLLSVTELQCVIRAVVCESSSHNAIATMTTTAKSPHSLALVSTAASTENIYGCVMTKVATATADKKYDSKLQVNKFAASRMHWHRWHRLPSSQLVNKFFAEFTFLMLCHLFIYTRIRSRIFGGNNQENLHLPFVGEWRELRIYGMAKNYASQFPSWRRHRRRSHERQRPRPWRRPVKCSISSRQPSAK